MKQVSLCLSSAYSILSFYCYDALLMMARSFSIVSQPIKQTYASSLSPRDRICMFTCWTHLVIFYFSNSYSVVHYYYSLLFDTATFVAVHWLVCILFYLATMYISERIKLKESYISNYDNIVYEECGNTDSRPFYAPYDELLVYS